MGKILLRLFLKFAKKFAIKALEGFLAEYAKDKFEGVLDAPSAPEIEDFPTLPPKKEKENKSIDDEEIKDFVVHKAEGLGVIALGIGGLAENASKADVESASRDLDNIKEDWDDNLLPVALIVGRGVTSVVENFNLDSVSFPKFEYTLPTFNFESLPTFDCIISREFYDGVETEEDEEYKPHAKRTSSSAATSEGGGFFQKKKTSGGEKPKIKRRLNPHRYAGRTTITRIDDPLTLLSQYSYDVMKKTIGDKNGGKTRKINKIILHCTDTPEGRETSVKEIESWHIKRNFDGIGYHYVIHLDGTIESARPLSLAGAHCEGYNSYSIGIAYVGGRVKGGGTTPKDTRTLAQKKRMWMLVMHLLKYFPSATVHGHNEFTSLKACPSFNVKKEWERLKNANFNLDILNESPKTKVIASTNSIRTTQYADDNMSQKSEVNELVSNEI